MLSWMHQTIVSEKEFLIAVFQNEINGLSIDDVDLQTSISKLAIYEMLIRCIQGLGRPLRSRIMQTIENRSNSIDILYSIADLLCFYESTLSRLLPLENVVHSAVKGCFSECKRIFTASLNKQGGSISSSVLSHSLDLTPVYMTKECAKQLREILRVYSSMMSTLSQSKYLGNSEQDENVVNDLHIDNVLGGIIQPILQACRLCSSNTLQGVDAALFMLNNVSQLLYELKDNSSMSNACKESTKTWISMLHIESDSWEDILVREETLRTLMRCDMDKIIDLIDVLPPGLCASEQPGLSNGRVSNILSSLVEKLIDPELRSKCRVKIALAISSEYEKVIFLNFDNNVTYFDVYCRCMQLLVTQLICTKRSKYWLIPLRKYEYYWAVTLPKCKKSFLLLL